MIFQELKQCWLIAKKVLIIVGVALSFFAVMELVRAYQILSEAHWSLGYGFLGLLTILILWACGSFYVSVRHLPRTLTPPATENIVRYGKYLTKYLARLETNENLTDEHISLIRQGRRELQYALAHKKKSEIESTVKQVEEEQIAPVLKHLDGLADQKIRSGTRDIMFAVTLSPYRSVDLLVVIFRIMAVVKNIALVYKSRPALRESMMIMIDTARVVAAVNFVNLGGKMIENLTKGLPGIIPGVSRIVDDCTEGLAAGLLTSVTGHAAQDRCRAYRRWDYEEAKQNIATHLKTFSADVGKMFFKDIIPNVRIPGGVTMEKWREVKENIAQGFNDTIGAFQNWVGGSRRSHS